MHPTQTGIAVALALVVVIAFFIAPGLWPFGAPSPSGTDVQSRDIQANSNTNTMPAGNVSGLQTIDTRVGSGEIAEAGDSVTVHYVGRLIDGKVFDASRNRGNDGFTFTLGVGQVIRGWDEGVIGMREGGMRTLVIPASLAYGDQAIGNVIPANSTLVFEVELLKVEKGGQ